MSVEQTLILACMSGQTDYSLYIALSRFIRYFLEIQKLNSLSPGNMLSVSFKYVEGPFWWMGDLRFYALLTVLQLYQDDMWVIMKGCVQWRRFIHLHRVSKPGSLDHSRPVNRVSRSLIVCSKWVINRSQFDVIDVYFLYVYIMYYAKFMQDNDYLSFLWNFGLERPALTVVTCRFRSVAFSMDFFVGMKYSRTSMPRTLIARLPWLFRTRSWVTWKKIP